MFGRGFERISGIYVAEIVLMQKKYIFKKKPTQKITVGFFYSFIIFSTFDLICPS